MKSTWYRSTKTLLCIALMINLNLLAAGCGQFGDALPDGSVRIDLTADHPLTAQLQGTDLDGATAIMINPSTQSFSLVYPDTDRQFSGSFTNGPTGRTIREATYAIGADSVTYQMDENKQLTSITTSSGAAWHRPADWSDEQGSIATGPDAYVSANAQVLDCAAGEGLIADTSGVDTDQEGADGTNGVKSAQSGQFVAIAGIAAATSALFWGTILFILRVLGIIL